MDEATQARLFEMIGEKLAFPFGAKVGGRAVTVEGVEEVPILGVTPPTPPPCGARLHDAALRDARSTPANRRFLRRRADLVRQGAATRPRTTSSANASAVPEDR